MRFIIQAATDVGLRKKVNQDSLTIKTAATAIGPVAFAVLCDGMGGLELGEVASASVVARFSRWFDEELPSLLGGTPEDGSIRGHWGSIVSRANVTLAEFGRSHGTKLGTTAAVLLVTPSRYFILNVGDSRVYELAEGIGQLTEDQTLVAREVAMGRITPAEALDDPRSNVLLQCIGASPTVRPDFYFGAPRPGGSYLLCSDGFRRLVSPEEIWQALHPGAARNEAEMQAGLHRLIELVKQRGELDNISAAVVHMTK